jgi:hypothetical protein
MVTALIVGGPLVAFGLTALTSIELEVGKEEGRFTASVAIHLGWAGSPCSS